MTLTSMIEVQGDAKHIAERLAVPAGLALPKSPKPILSDLLVEAVGGVLRFTGSDGIVTVEQQAERVDVRAEGRCTVNAARFSAVVREFAAEGVTLAMEIDSNGKLILRVPGSKVALPTSNVADYPETPRAPERVDVTLAGADLALAFDRTAFAAADLKGRLATDGVCVESLPGSDEATFVATDGKRLARVDVKLAEKRGDTRVFIVVPKVAATVIAKLARGSSDSWTFSANDGLNGFPGVFLSSPGVRMFARPIEGHYPPYRDVLDKFKATGIKRLVTLKRDDFVGALRRAALLATKETAGVRMQFVRGEVTMTARTIETGETESTVPCTLVGDDLRIGFQPSYWMETLKHVQGDEVSFTVWGTPPSAPAVVTAQVNERMAMMHLVMPLDLKESE